MSVTGLERGEQIDGVEDAEALLADVGAQPRRAADHLLVQDAAAHAAQEHQVRDRRDVDAGGQQVDGDRDVRDGARSGSAGSPRAACRRLPVIFSDGVVVDGAVLARRAPPYRRTTRSACSSVAQKTSVFPGLLRVDVFRELAQDRAVEVLGDDASVEARRRRRSTSSGSSSLSSVCGAGVEDGHLLAAPC